MRDEEEEEEEEVKRRLFCSFDRAKGCKILATKLNIHLS